MNKYLIIILFLNIISILLYGIDKYKAIHKKERISEISLLTISMLAPLGALLGMLIFHHKIKKLKFKILIPIFLIINIFIYINYYI